MKTIIFLLCILIVFAITASAQQQQLTLQQAIATALDKNVLTRRAALQAANAEINYQQAKNNRLPVAESGYNYGFNSGRSIDPFTNGYINQQLTSSNVNAQASLPLFNGFQLKNTIRQNELNFATATMEWQQQKDELTLQVIMAYLQVLNSEDALKLAKQQAGITKEQLDRIQVIDREGATSPANVSDLRGQYAGDELAIINAENTVATSFITLTQLMQIPYTGDLIIDRTGFSEKITPYESVPDEIYSTALLQLASVKAADLRVQASAAAVKVASSAFYPRVSLYGVLNTNYSSAAMINQNLGTVEVPTTDYVVVNGNNLPVISKRTNFSSRKIQYGNQLNNNLSSAYGVSLAIPLFNGSRARTNVKLAKNERKTNELLAENTKYQLKQAIAQAYQNITTTYKRYLALEKQEDAYKESFRIAQLRFENGVINSPEYLIAKNNLDRTKANLITTRYEYLLRSKVLDFYMGKL